jgi:NADPH:quinone reductase-like Zn-dependent oxidoreductase
MNMRIPGSLEQLTEADWDSSKGEFVLVAGGSTATGTRAIQFLKL